MDMTKTFFIASTTLSALGCGYMAGLSTMTCPTLLLLPADKLAVTWAHMYRLGFATSPPISILSGLSSFVLSYLVYHPSAPERSYKLIGAGALAISIVPYTMLVMLPTNDELMAREKAVKETGSEDAKVNVKRRGGVEKMKTHDLVRQWANLNLGRAVLPFLATLLAFEAL